MSVEDKTGLIKLKIFQFCISFDVNDIILCNKVNEIIAKLNQIDIYSTMKSV